MFKIVRTTGEEWSEEEIRALTVGLRSGQPCIESLIEAHITLANKIAGFFSRHHIHRKEDIYAAAYSGLTEAVNKAASVLYDDNITAYVARSIKGAIQMFVVSDCLIPIPRGEFKSRMEKEDAVSFVLRTSNVGRVDIFDREVHISGVMENIAVILPLTNKVMENIDIPVMDYSLQKMEDLYSTMQLTPTEVHIIDRRLDGMTLQEIAAELGVTHPAIIYHIQNIKTKLSKVGLKFHSAEVSGTKTCTKCDTEKSLSRFYKISEGKYKSICKECLKEVRNASVC